MPSFPRLRGLFAVATTVAPCVALAAAEIDPTLRQKMAAQPAQQLPVIVMFGDRPDFSTLKTGPDSAGDLIRDLQDRSKRTARKFQAWKQQASVKSSSEHFWIANCAVTRLTSSQIEALAKNPDVERIEADLGGTGSDAVSGQTGGSGHNLVTPYGIRIIGGELVWQQLSLTGQGVLVGVMDSGMDIAHPALAGKWIGGPNAWFDAFNATTSPYDDHGHGTHVTGTIVGGDGPGPFADDIGLAYQARVIPAKVLDSNNSFDSASRVLGGAQFLLDPDGNPATNDFPRVINNSWGFSSSTTTAFYNAAAAWRAAGIVPVFSMGNSGPGASTGRPPATYDNVIAVGGTNSSDQRYASSSEGPSPTGAGFPADRRKPDVSAPAVSVRSSLPNNNYGNFSGTSMAAPHVAGTLVLMMQAKPALTYAEAMAALRNTAVDLGTVDYDFIFGYGRINALAAIQTVQVPEILLTNNGFPIPNGDSTPSLAEGSDFGPVLVTQPLARTFSITNKGVAPLQLRSSPPPVSLANSGTRFSVSIQPQTTIAPGGTALFVVSFSPTVGGVQTNTVQVAVVNVPGVSSYTFAITGMGVESGPFSPGLTNPFPSAAGWSPIGQLPPLFTSAFGSRQHDAVNTALAVTVAPNPRGRVIGWVEDPDNDLRYADIGPGNFVRAKFSMFYSGPGDSASATLFNRVPNFRLALRMRGMVQTVLEVNHNPEIAGSPAQAFVTRELGPSKNPAAPSVYRVDLDPVDVPYFTNSTTEGVQRAFEAVMTEPKDYSFVEGTLALTDSSIGTYPALSDAVTPVKTWASGGTAGAADFDNPTVVTGGLSLTVADLLRYLGGPSPADYYNPAVLNPSLDTTPATITRSTAGVTVNTAGLATTRVAALTANLLGGVFGDTPATRLRVEPGRLYRVSARVSHAGPSDTTPFTRLGVRTAGFGWNQTLELLGARGLPAATGTRPGLAQMLPGAGNQVPGTTAEGTVYNLLLGTPLHPQIRADVAGTIAAKFPNLSAQPGPGDPATGAGSPPDGSLRNVNLAFTVIDSLSPASATATDPAEVANNLRLNRVEIRIYPDVVD